VDTDDRQGSNAGAGRSDDLNLHVAWRMTAARRIAEGYEYDQRLAALTVAGSVGAGLADRWSDLELDAYWWQPPTDADRRTPIDRAGAVLEDFWDYDAPEQEWSENYRL
jgi:hypothetical protein